MDKQRFLIGMSLLVLLAAFTLGANQVQATFYANSPIIPKFTDPLPGIPVATPQTPPAGVPTDGDYYEINAVQTTWQFSSALPATTKVRGYMQNGKTYSYLGPMIVAQKNRPVRLKFTNRLPKNTIANPTAGNLFLPVDTNLMGAGMGPLGLAGGNYPQNRTSLHLHGGDTPWISDGTPHQWIAPAGEISPYKRGVSQMNVPDMPAQPAGAETLCYVNQQSGRLMWYHDHAFGITRLNVYAGLAAPYLVHDPAEDALIANGTIPTGGGLTQGTNWGVPLVIQDKTFVGANTAAQDPNWATVAAAWGSSTNGDLWFPHVYEFNQTGSFAAGSGVNPQGRWDYGPYVWPPAFITDTASGYANSMGMPLPAAVGDVRDPSCVPESFMDTMVVNGKAYPTLTVQPKAYRFRILNACNDRYLNLQLYYAANSGPFPAVALPSTNPAYASNITSLTTLGAAADKEVSMVKADATTYAIPAASVQFGNPVQNEAGTPTQLFYVPPAGPLAGKPTVAVPFDGRVGGVPDPRQIGPQMIQIGNDGGLLPSPIVLANTCIDYTYDRKQITFGNVRNYALQIPNPAMPSQILNYPHPGQNLHLGPAERADVVIDFSTVPPGSTIIVYNDAPAPQPGFDPRYDYYTGDPDYSNSLMGLGMGGAASTAPGMGPNTRTIMQIKVQGTAAPNPNLLTNLQAALPTYFAANQPAPLVPPGTYAPIQLVAGQTFNGIPVFNKTIAEDFEPVWGRMNAMLGTEQASTNSQGQQTFGFHFADPITEIINPFYIYNTATPVNPTAPYGTQLWKVTHNGVDTHAIHFHLFNVQVVNRVDWAGMIKPPDPNETGWKETVRMNPLEDCVVALKPKVPTLPATMGPLPNSVRPLDPTMPVGMTNAMFWSALPVGAVVPNFPFTNPGPNLVTVVNNQTNFGWEYIWHCHLLGHEENDMMRTISVQVAPAAPSKLTRRRLVNNTINLAWVNNETIQTGFTFLIQRATNTSFTTGLTQFTVTAPTTTFSDTTAKVRGTTYFYRVRAQNAQGYSAWVRAAAILIP